MKRDQKPFQASLLAKKKRRREPTDGPWKGDRIKNENILLITWQRFLLYL